MILDLRDRWGVSKYILKHGVYDPQITQTVKRVLKPGCVCIDVGANIGFWSLFLLKEVRAKKVIAIEPEPSNLRLLNTNLDLNDVRERVDIHACAAGSSPGELQLFLSGDNSGDHQLYATGENRPSVRVQVRRLDELSGRDEVAFVKMDIQGYEPYAFDGMTQIFESSPDVVILTEWWPAGIRRAGRDPEETLRSLEARGMNFYFLDETEAKLRVSSVSEISARLPGELQTDIFISRQNLAEIAS